MTGKELRVQRLFARSEKLVIAAMDHGGFMGPSPGLEEPDRTCRQFARADAVLMMPGMISSLAQHFTTPQAPLVITRLLWNSAYCLQWHTCESQHVGMFSVAEAVARGADVVLASLSLHTPREAVDANNVGLFCRCIEESRQLGVPMVGEFFPTAVDKMSPEELHDTVKVGCRAIAEMGADMIKSFYTGERFNEIVAATPIPIMVLGAEKTPTERDALQLASKAAQAGARGIVFGRNIFQSCNPAGFIDAARAVMAGQTGIDQAIKTHGLE